MKAVQISAYGDADQLKIQKVENPQPKANQVLVQVYDAGVNPFDWKVRSGSMKEVMPVQFPLTMGYDFAGVIVSVGQEVQKLKQGDRVFGFTQGAYAEFAVATEDKIAKIPEPVSFEVAAALPTPGLTAYQLIVDQVKASAGQKILIHGAAGAVGSIAVQVARSKGATVYANAAATDEKYLKELGVEKVIDYKTQRFEEFIHDVDAVVDLVGGQTLERSFQCLKKGGLLVSTVGPLPEGAAQKWGVQARMFFTQQTAEGLEQVADLVASGKVKLRSAEVMPLEKAAEAQRMYETGKSQGKVILRVSQ